MEDGPANQLYRPNPLRRISNSPASIPLLVNFKYVANRETNRYTLW